MAFEDTYVSPMQNDFTGYYGATKLTLLSHLYTHCVRISMPELAENYRKI